MGKACWELTSCSHGSVCGEGSAPKALCDRENWLLNHKATNLAAKATNKITRCVCKMYVCRGRRGEAGECEGI